jgi:Transposase and inactivated derivatives
MSYDIKFRKRTIEYLESGNSYREVSKVFGISPTTLRTWVKKRKTTGSLADTPLHRGFRKIDPEKLKAYIAKNPEAYQTEIARYFGCSQQGVFKALKRLGISRKKRRRVTGNKTPKK